MLAQVSVAGQVGDDSQDSHFSPSKKSSLLLAHGFTRRLTLRAVPAVSRDANTAQTAGAAPPLGPHGAAVVPVLGDAGTTLANVLAVVVAEVIPEVVSSVKGLAVARTAAVVTPETLLLLFRHVGIAVVALEVCGTFERPRIAVWVEAGDGPVSLSDAVAREKKVRLGSVMTDR